jgi:hypothetical protein
MLIIKGRGYRAGISEADSEEPWFPLNKSTVIY